MKAATTATTATASTTAAAVDDPCSAWVDAKPADERYNTFGVIKVKVPVEVSQEKSFLLFLCFFF